MYNYSIPVAAGEDLSSVQWRAVNISGTLAATPALALGLLMNKPDASGEDASLIYMGRSKFAAGGAITAGGPITVTTSGWLIAAAVVSGGSTRVVGRAHYTVVSGGIGEGIFNFVNGTLVAFD